MEDEGKMLIAALEVIDKHMAGPSDWKQTASAFH